MVMVDNPKTPWVSDRGDMDLFRYSRVTVFSGGYGSGKTELAANFASRIAESGAEVSLIDIDIVKPMFRSRELRQAMAERGVRLISTLANLEMSDLPALSPEIAVSIGNMAMETVIDVGGDDIGARALGRFSEALRKAGYEMMYVINTRRPFSSEVDSIVAMLESIQRASRLEVTALVANSNMGSESTVGIAEQGLALVRQVSDRTGIPLRFAALHRSCVSIKEAETLSAVCRIPVFLMDRFLLPPWEREE